MENKIGSIKIDGVVSDSVLIAEVIEYACKNGPYSYFELIENISERVMECQKGEVSIDTLINGRNPEKHLDVIVRNSKFFKDYFNSVENDEYHSIETSWTMKIPDSNNDDSDEEDKILGWWWWRLLGPEYESRHRERENKRRKRRT